MHRPVILLATFNGAGFLEPLIASLAAQTFSSWSLLARDDGSQDETRDILERWAASDARVTLVENDGRRQPSVISNFSALLDAAAETQGDVFFFCDQDDIWEPTKLEVCLNAFMAPAVNGPRLVVTDLTVVDAGAAKNLGTFWAANMMPPKHRRTVQELCSRNLYPGCSMAFNRDLLALARGVPDTAIVHDWWLAVLARATGEIIEITQPLVRYRQHGGNATGATSVWGELKALLCGTGHQSELFLHSFEQAEAAADRLCDRGYEAAAAPLRHYGAIAKRSTWEALKMMRKLRLRSYHPGLYLAFSLRLLLLSPSRRSMGNTA